MTLDAFYDFTFNDVFVSVSSRVLSVPLVLKVWPASAVSWVCPDSVAREASPDCPDPL